MSKPSHVAYYHPDMGVLPDAAPDPWREVGTPSTTLTTQRLTIGDASATAGYGRRGLPGDGESAPPRPDDRMELQADFQGATAVPGWPGGTPEELTLAQDVVAGGRRLDKSTAWAFTATSFIGVYGKPTSMVLPTTGPAVGHIFGHFGLNIFEGGVTLGFTDATTLALIYRDAGGVGGVVVATYTLPAAWANTPNGFWARLTPTSVELGVGPYSDGNFTTHAIQCKVGTPLRQPSLFASSQMANGGTTWEYVTPIFVNGSITDAQINRWMTGDLQELIDSGVSSGEVFLWANKATVTIGDPITGAADMKDFGGGAWQLGGFTIDPVTAGPYNNGASTPTAGSEASPHCMLIDDGERAIALAIGDDLELVDPSDGSRLALLASSYHWTVNETYRLVKRGAASWDVYVGGRLVHRQPYIASPPSTRATPWYQIGVISPGGASSGSWSDIDVGTNVSLAPTWKVRQIQNRMPPKVQQAWSARWRAAVKAVAGVHQTGHDAMAELYDELTADVLWLDTATFSGEIDTDDEPDDWSKEGTNAAANMEVRRERIRMLQSVNPIRLTHAFDAPTTPASVILHARGTCTLRDHVVDDPRGRVGPAILLQDGNRALYAVMVHARHNPDQYQWVLSDGSLGGSLGNQGERITVEPQESHVVDVWIIERTWVVLAVDGFMADVQPYDTFSGSGNSTCAISFGRDGANDPDQIRAIVEWEQCTAQLGYAAQRWRPWLQQRVAERLLFAAGCEPNALLDVLGRHLPDVHRMRGTTLGIRHEARRLTCDDNYAMVVERSPGSWYLGITWPMHTPVFIGGSDYVIRAYIEYTDQAANFTAAELRELLETYILPMSVVELRFRAVLATLLTSATVDATSTSSFDVASTDGFAEGDDVTLRELQSGTVLSVTYDADRGMTAATDLHNFALGLAAGPDAGDAGDSAIDLGEGAPLYQSAYAVFTTNGPAYAVADIVDLTGGFTAHARTVWYDATGAGNGRLWATQDRNPRGFSLYLSTTDGYVYLRLWSAAGTLQEISASGYTPTVGDWCDITAVVDATHMRIYIDGSERASAALTITPASPTSGNLIALGDGASSNNYLDDAFDLWFFERDLSPSEVAALHAGFRNDTPRNLHDDTLVAALLPAGFSPVQSLVQERPTRVLSPDHVYVASYDNYVWAKYLTRVDGEGWDDTYNPDGLQGLLALPALDADKQNDQTPGEVVVVEGFSAVVNCTATVWGIDDNTGAPAWETFEIVAGAAVTGTTVWTEVHGLTIDSIQGAAVRVYDESDSDQLYVVGAGNLSSGVYYWPSNLFVGPSEIDIKSSGATTDNVLVFAAVEDGGFEGEEVTLDGTNWVSTTNSWTYARVISASHVPTGQTLSVETRGMDPTGVIELTSTDAADTMLAYVLSLDANLEPQWEAVQLTGLTGANGTLAMRKLLGVWFAEEGAGDLDVRTTGGIVDVIHQSYDTTVQGRAFGGTVCDFRTVGRLRLRLSQAASTVRQIGVWGLDLDGALQLSVIDLDGTNWVEDTLDFSRIYGIFTGALTSRKWINVEGRMWRAEGVFAAAQELSLDVDWTVTTSAFALDAVLDGQGDTYATLGALSLTGTYSDYENTTIESIAGNTVTVPLLSNSFGIGARMRERR